MNDLKLCKVAAINVNRSDNSLDKIRHEMHEDTIDYDLSGPESYEIKQSQGSDHPRSYQHPVVRYPTRDFLDPALHLPTCGLSV